MVNWRSRRWWLASLLGLLAVAALTMRVAYLIHQPTQPTLIAPLSVVGEPGSTNLTVVFPWLQQGFCVGQFSVAVHESATTVAVSDVVDHGPGPVCGGIGTEGGVASVDVTLSTPLGKRHVVRATDGSVLHVASPPAG